MQAYNQGFARIYNQKWSGFARQVAPHILNFYAATPVGQVNKSVLDLCCGTGQLAFYFLEKGYRVVGLDLSEPMLYYARQNARPYLESNQAQFIQGDAANFTLDERFGLVVSTFDALNHLESFEALRNCFQSVFAVLLQEGLFIFDLNTRAGLLRWNNINIDDGPEAMIVTRGIYDGQSERAFAKISGFIRTEEGLYERFDETAFNTVFEMEAVRNLLLETGWAHVHFARLPDLQTPIHDPEGESRVFIVASK